MTNTSILYVEDDENDAFLMQHAFKQASVTNPFRIVRNGREAMDYLCGTGSFSDRANNPMPGLVLLDIKMPMMSGLELLEWIRQRPEFRKIVVIMYTSSHNDGDVERAYELGANSFIVKPSHIREITELARQLKGWWIERNQYSALKTALS